MPSGPVDTADVARKQQLACRTHIDGPKAAPLYPADAYAKEAEGNVLVRMRFTAPDSPPTIQVIAATSFSALKQSASRFSKG
jgi:hypothetical protein